LIIFYYICFKNKLINNHANSSIKQNGELAKSLFAYLSHGEVSPVQFEIMATCKLSAHKLPEPPIK